MTKIIKGSLDEIVEEIVKHLDGSNLVVCRTENPLDENEDFIPMSDKVSGSYIRTAIEKFVVEEEQTHTKSEVQAMFDPLRETINNQINEIDSLRKEIDFWVSSWNYLSKKFNEVNCKLTTPKKGGDDEA